MKDNLLKITKMTLKSISIELIELLKENGIEAKLQEEKKHLSPFGEKFKIKNFRTIN